MADPSIKYPSHRVLVGVKDGKITAVSDCFSGLTLRCFPVRFAVGEVVETGSISDKGHVSVDRKFWVVICTATWQKARSMANHTKSRDLSLRHGFWHEVISE